MGRIAGCRALAALSAVFLAGLSPQFASASIISSAQIREVSVDATINTESFANQSDFDSASDFLPFNSSVQATPTLLPESASALATQASSMDTLEIHVAGQTSASIQPVNFVIGDAQSSSSFQYVFTIDEAGIYSFDAAVFTQGEGLYSSSAGLDFVNKDTNTYLASLNVFGTSAQSVPATLLELEPGEYAIYGYALSEILVSGEHNPNGSSSTASFEANLVFVVPEPGALTLLAAGLMMTSVRRNRRRNTR
ncbi:MAG: PEP-CTERM sorting domain-containing protein [Phycisphaerae bacterium]|nr:PEP-CTERM sorting domain-containing protein [Phycisphaerae bacterium]